MKYDMCFGPYSRKIQEGFVYSLPEVAYGRITQMGNPNKGGG